MPYPTHGKCPYFLPRIQRNKNRLQSRLSWRGEGSIVLDALRFCIAWSFTLKLPLVLQQYGKVKHLTLRSSTARRSKHSSGPRCKLFVFCKLVFWFRNGGSVYKVMFSNITNSLRSILCYSFMVISDKIYLQNKFHRVYWESCREIRCDVEEIIRNSHMITCKSLYAQTYSSNNSLSNKLTRI